MLQHLQNKNLNKEITIYSEAGYVGGALDRVVTILRYILSSIPPSILVSLHEYR